MARLVQGLRSVIKETSTMCRLSFAPRIAVQQRCLHSNKMLALAGPALLRNVQVMITIDLFDVRLN